MAIATLTHSLLLPTQVVSKHSAVPEAQGLFNPENDKDSCGVGFVAELSKEPQRKTVTEALEMLKRMSHRGACGCEVNTGAYQTGHSAW
jgi:glutamate synthase (NADPH/NADH)